MTTNIERLPEANLARFETEALIVITAGRLEPSPWAQAADRASGGAITALLTGGEFAAKPLETVVLTRPAGLAAQRLVLAGRGDAPVTALDLWRTAGVLARQLKARNVRRIAIAVPREGELAVSAAAAVTALVTGVSAANFETGVYKSDRQPERGIGALTLLVPESAPAGLEQSVREAEIVAEGHRFARELANEPGNLLTPTILGERALQMAQAAGLECELIGAERAQELKMGAFLGVAQGSAEPPCMMVLHYRGNPGGKELLGIVGKGITFDSGGISIKPAANMDQMKFDMCGGAATLGAIQAIAALRLKINVVAVVAAAENMPGGKAIKPGDVCFGMSGKAIEVLNTDAEGRLVLADALTYARQLGATHLIDSATLTGACVVALGHVHSGVWANDESFYARFTEARARSGEKMWRLPLDPEYADQLRGSVGDLVNVAGRWGGAIIAAQFLKEFVGSTPWIHLDIAGTAWLQEDKPWMPKGPTGAPVYTLVELARVLAAARGSDSAR